MNDLYIDFTVSIGKINKLIQKIKSQQVAAYGLQPIHVTCIYCLSASANGLTAKELCETSLEDKAAVSRALQVLRQKGYVAFELHGKSKNIRLTEEGEKFANTISDRINAAVCAGKADITDEQRKFFYRSLTEISDNLVEYYQQLTNGGGIK